MKSISMVALAAKAEVEDPLVWAALAGTLDRQEEVRRIPLVKTVAHRGNRIARALRAQMDSMPVNPELPAPMERQAPLTQTRIIRIVRTKDSVKKIAIATRVGLARRGIAPKRPS